MLSAKSASRWLTALERVAACEAANKDSSKRSGALEDERKTLNLALLSQRRPTSILLKRSLAYVQCSECSFIAEECGEERGGGERGS